MAGVKDILFGTAPEAVVESRDVVNADQKTALKRLLEDLQGPAPKVGVDVTAEQQALIDQSVGDKSVATGELDQSTAALQKLLNPAGSFEDQVQNPLIRDFNENILPQISRGFGNDFFSSERQLQDQRATEDLLQSLVGEKSRFLREDRANILGASQGLNANAGSRGDVLKEFLATAGVGRDILENANLKDESVRQELLKLLLGGATSPTRETVGISKGGSSGLAQGFISGLGEGIGGSVF